MEYKFSETAGYYGNGGWICYSLDWHGNKCVYKVFGTEEEAAKYCGKKIEEPKLIGTTEDGMARYSLTFTL